MKAPKPAKEDPAVTAARTREEARAQAERRRQIQAQIIEEQRGGPTMGLSSRGLVSVTPGTMRSRLGAG
mgnify:CR=1 FL=1